ncbi:MAG TPA: aldehyde dehydrogenase family protein [Bacteroidota bacterium]|nr:aldehyde dehydrogenase family protein [Bacteroidota bacterium]
MRLYQLFINDQFVDGTEKRTFTSLNPFSGETLATCARAGADDARRAVEAARIAFDEGPWPRMTREERSGYLKKLSDALNANAPRFVELEVADTGSTLRKAKEDVYLSARALGSYAKFALVDLTEKLDAVSRPGVSTNILVREPVGVVAAIIPWNFSLKMAAWKLGPALAAGNTVVLKPSEETPVTAMELARLIHDTGFPPGVVNIITGFGEDAGAELCRSGLVDKVAFTGSTGVGKLVMQAAAGTLKKITLECGGKSANIVLDDADIELAVDGALYAAFYHQGQCCEAGSRLFLPERIADEFVERLGAGARAMKTGDPMNVMTDLGPLISRRQQESVLGYIAAGKRDGARLVAGGGMPRDSACARGFFVEPTIFDNVENSWTIAREEIFGPVLSVLRYREPADAVRMANDSPYGLAAGVWSKDPVRAMDVARSLRAGTVWINEWHLLNERAPFGGYKQSGVGREFGLDGLKEYTEAKHIHVDEAGSRDKKPWYDTVVPRH